MPISEQNKKNIEDAVVTNATNFIFWISNSIPNICDSPEEEREITKKFVQSKLSPSIAFEIIKQTEKDQHLQSFRNSTKGDLDAEPFLLQQAIKERQFPADYPELIRSLVLLYQNKNSQANILNVIYDLLHIPKFRESFKNDNALAPFFMDGFYDALQGVIHEKCQDKSLKDELLTASDKKSPDSTMIDNELMKVFGYNEKLSDEEKDIIAIQKFLANALPNSPIMKQLELLEKALEKEALGKEKYDPQTRLLKGYEEGKPFKHDKLLSGFLRRWAEENNFTGYGRLKGFMSQDKFFEFIGKGGIFKDPVLRGEFHGEFTHAIQWYLITMWSNEDQNKPKLKCHPTRLLQWIGENGGKFKEWSETFEASVTSLYKPSLMDFRKVDNLHKYLNSSACPFPVLHQLNLGRSAKGSPEFQMDIAEFEKFEPKVKK